VHSFAGDQANPATHDELVAQHAAAFGDLDVLVCNAGTTRRSMLAENRPRDLERLFAVNVSAPFLLVRAALPLLRHAARARGSALVALTSSIAAQRAVSGYSLYSATKSALSSLARSINEEEAPASGVRACAIEPGFVDTPMTEVLRDELGADAMLSPSDVAEVLRMLLRLSPAAVVGEVVIARRTAPHLAP
jgi:NAD(P)-dependent dehydrogenase (short-subunit alcohol dehydrogenase family)